MKRVIIRVVHYWAQFCQHVAGAWICIFVVELFILTRNKHSARLVFQKIGLVYNIVCTHSCLVIFDWLNHRIWSILVAGKYWYEFWIALNGSYGSVVPSCAPSYMHQVRAWEVWVGPFKVQQLPNACDVCCISFYPAEGSEKSISTNYRGWTLERFLEKQCLLFFIWHEFTIASLDIKYSPPISLCMIYLSILL